MIYHFKKLNEISVLNGIKALVRLDLNVPMKGDVITDFTRIEKVLPTLKFLIDHKAQVIILSHLGRPDGKHVPALSLKPVAEALKHWIPISFCPDIAQLDSVLKPGSAVMLENIRFDPREEADDASLAKEWATHADIYVNDAFSVSHRAHASVVAITKLLPSYPGFLMEEELTALKNTLERPERPLIALIGGSKISTKLEILEHLSQKVDVMIIGGGMANTFLKAQGFEIGSSLVEPDLIDTAWRILTTAKAQILLPQDVMIAESPTSTATPRCIPLTEMTQDQMILDVGPESCDVFKEAIKKSKTLIWNGPLGVFEIPPFDQGTNTLARFVAERTRNGKLLSVAGGGDTIAALDHAGVLEDLSFVSTAGGAFLEWLEGKSLPGVEALCR